MSNLIRYCCTKCGMYSRGGVEDKECPNCGGSLVPVAYGCKE